MTAIAYRDRRGFVARRLERLAGAVVLLDGWRRAALALVAGAFAVLALPPFNFPAVGFVSFPLLVWLLDGVGVEPGSRWRSVRSAFACGWFFGFGYFVAGLWWLGAAMMVDAGSFAVFIPFAVLGLPAVLALFYGAAAALARSVWSDSAFRLFSLAGSLALAEYLRGIVLTGFPWNEIGLMAAPVPVAMQTLSLVGLHGLTLMAVLVFAAPAALVDRRGARPVIAIAVLLALFHLGFGAWRLAAHPTRFVETVDLRVVQPNILQALKWDAAEAERIFDRHLTLTTTRRPPQEAGRPAPASANVSGAGAKVIDVAAATTERRTLVVWPESSFPFILTQTPEAIARIADALQPGETLIAGAARIEGEDLDRDPVYNSVYVIDDQGAILDARDKVHLVPFGEYLPLQSFLEGLGLRQLTDLPGGFSAGGTRSPVPLAGAPSFLPLVCYEIIFPGEIAAGEGAERPGFLVNVTNDAWYGATPGPYQHLRLAEATAVAFGLPLVRSANTGVSVVTDAYGRLVAGLSLNSTGTIEVLLPEAADATIYARFRYIPFWVLFAMTWAVAVASLWTMRARID